MYTSRTTPHAQVYTSMPTKKPRLIITFDDPRIFSNINAQAHLNGLSPSRYVYQLLVEALTPRDPKLLD